MIPLYSDRLKKSGDLAVGIHAVQLLCKYRHKLCFQEASVKGCTYITACDPTLYLGCWCKCCYFHKSMYIHVSLIWFSTIIQDKHLIGLFPLTHNARHSTMLFHICKCGPFCIGPILSCIHCTSVAFGYSIMWSSWCQEPISTAKRCQGASNTWEQPCPKQELWPLSHWPYRAATLQLHLYTCVASVVAVR